MSTGRLRKHLDLLKVLARGKPRLVKALVSKLDREEVACICECCYNVLRGNVPLSGNQKRKLRRFKLTLQRLTERKRSVGSKRKILNQTGSGFPFALLAPILAIATSLLSDGKF